ncbi:MAG: DUF5367 domain-containing protein [Roseivirga sp.]|nr:DUF5367 domain-containing protein [Roseivirga sp.]
MNIKRAITAGSLVWLGIFSLFAIFNFIPGIRDSESIQGLLIGVVIIPMAWQGTAYYYKKGAGGHGLSIALIMMAVAMALDAIITVPLIEIPLHDRNHYEFFTYPLLYILVAENILVIWLYWKLKIKH